MLKVKSMAFNELVKAKAKIEAELELRAAKERSSLIEAIGRLRRLSATKANGAATGRPHALKGRKLPPLYRNPKNRAETWAGRGNRPRWLVAALKGGKKLQTFAIK
jgi:DNA-binding protein H-NS